MVRLARVPSLAMMARLVMLAVLEISARLLAQLGELGDNRKDGDVSEVG